MQENWLSLTDYSSKYRVSISTLRRRIKTETVPYKLSDGKYLLLDEQPPGTSSFNLPFMKSSEFSAPTAEFAEAESELKRLALVGQAQSLAQAEARAQTTAQAVSPSGAAQLNPALAGSGVSSASTAFVKAKDEPVIASATKLLNELKRAYTQILQDKEEQILLLKEEVTDLRTLVRVLEDDNNRMKNMVYSIRR